MPGSSPCSARRLGVMAAIGPCGDVVKLSPLAFTTAPRFARGRAPRALVGAPSRSAIEADSPAMGETGRAHHQGRSSNLN
jgi:hypothetical protein